MTEPYYADEWVTLYHGDCRPWLSAQPDRSFDCVITDPPYDERTHTMARSECAGAPWIKTNPMPIYSGDRPAMGWEPIVCLHRDDLKPAWNGGGHTINYVGPTAQGTGHPTAKPLPMITDWVRKFTAPGDLILDPFAGTGTTGRAAKDAGRRAVLWEEREDYCELIAGRLSDSVRPAMGTLFDEALA